MKTNSKKTSKMKYLVCRKFCKLCTLQTSCKLRSLIYNDFLTNGSLHAEVRCKHLQTKQFLYKSITYVKLLFARRPLSLREREANPAYAGLPLQDTAMLVGHGGAV